MMKQAFLVLSVVLTTLSSGLAQTANGTANDRDGVVTYIECSPANQYRHLGVVQCSSFAPDKLDLMIEHMFKQARKKHEEFDAMIFRPGTGLCKADVIQFYRDPKVKRKKPKKGEEAPEINPEYKMSTTPIKDEMYLFVENSPTVEYQLLGKVEVPATFRSSDFEKIIEEMQRVAKEAYPDLDGIVFVSGSELRKANVIKLQ